MNQFSFTVGYAKTKVPADTVATCDRYRNFYELIKCYKENA